MHGIHESMLPTGMRRGQRHSWLALATAADILWEYNPPINAPLLPIIVRGVAALPAAGWWHHRQQLNLTKKRQLPSSRCTAQLRL